MALMHRREKNYKEAVKCYTNAMKNVTSVTLFFARSCGDDHICADA
jgi:hypothetical protein